MDKIETFCPPEPSRATRQPSSRSTASSRATLVAAIGSSGTLRRYLLESILELRVLYLLLARHDVIDIWDQPPPVFYPDEKGKKRKHTFDFLIQTVNGMRTAIAVKPFERAQRTQFHKRLRLIRKATKQTYADRIVLVTECSFSRDDAINAARLQEFRRYPDAEADKAIDACLTELAGEISLSELSSMAGLNGRGYRAAFRAIFNGTLSPIRPGIITPSSIVTRSTIQ